jgi:two-component system response regulator YesN
MPKTGAERHPLTASLLRKIGLEYRTRNGLPLLCVDQGGKILWQLGACPLLQKMGKNRILKMRCEQYHAKSVEESLRWGEPNISVCPFGLVLFSVPITKGKEILGGLVSGFTLFPQMKSDFKDDLAHNLKAAGFKPALAGKRHFRIKAMAADETRLRADNLFNLVMESGMTDTGYISERREKKIQQYAIANVVEETRQRKADTAAELIGMQNEIIEKAIQGDPTASRKIINRFLGVIFLESGMHFDILKVRLLELIIIISRAAIERGINAEGLLGSKYSYLTEINSASGLDDLFWKVTRILENFIAKASEQRGKKKQIHVSQMLRHVKEHFTERITADDLSQLTGLSVSRLLHLFKEETGFSLSEYILHERIAKAKKLLTDSNKRLGDIALECGFYDQSHFTRSFKALEKSSPLKYRKRMLNPDSFPAEQE